MNDDQVYTRLRFAGRRGVAKMHGMTVSLDAGPDLGDGPVWAIDYVPETGIRRIQLRSIDPPRDMEPAEIVAADALLRRLTTLPEIER